MGLLKQEYASGPTFHYGTRRQQQRYESYYNESSDDGGCLEDPEIEQIQEQQKLEVVMGTQTLNELEMDHAEKDAQIAPRTNKGSAVGISSLLDRSSSTLSANSGSFEKGTKLPFEKILKLLLASMEKSFAPTIPKQKCASPVPYNSETRGFHPMFYVSKERKLAKQDDGFEGIPVRYQGFTKSTVWFSEETPCWGIVARRMQHQSRMKQKQLADQQNMASKAALFFHVFEGFSYVLIQRSTPEEHVEKSKVSNFIVENAAKFVQIWPIQKPIAKSVAAPKQPSVLKEETPTQRTLGCKRYLQTRLSYDNSFRESKRQNASDELLLNFDNPNLDFLDNDYFYSKSQPGEEAEPQLQQNVLNALEGVMLSDGTEASAAGIAEDVFQDIFTDFDTDTCPSDASGSMLADDIFKVFCDCSNKHEMNREYGRMSLLLFSPKFARSLRTAVDNCDPRVQADFLFPDTAEFYDSSPIAKIQSEQANPEQGDLIVTFADDEANKILGTDNVVGTVDFLETLDKSDTSYVLCKYYFLTNSRPKSFWFHRIITKENGDRAVIRGHSACTQNGTTNTCTTSLQDVTFLYQDLLNLSPLE